MTIPVGQWTMDDGEVRVVVEESLEGMQAPDEMNYAGWAGVIRFQRVDKAGGVSDLVEWPSKLIVQITFPNSLHVFQPDRAGIYILNEEDGQWRYVPSQFDSGDNEIRFLLGGNGTWALMIPRVTFTDMFTHWARIDVEVLAGRQIIHGRGDHMFDPELNITRAEYVALLLRLLGLTHLAADGLQFPFSDVDAKAWYANDVTMAWSLGLVSGVSATEFAPEGAITREQMGVLLYRAWQYVLSNDYINDDTVRSMDLFVDLDHISLWAMEGMSFAVRHGIIQGRAADRLAPSDTATRAEAATMLKRFADLLSSTILMNK